MVIPDAAPAPGKSGSDVDNDNDAGNPIEDIVAAIIFIVVGVGAFIIALDYRAGTVHRMGPGIFPLLVSGIMVAIGVALGAQALIAYRLHRVSGGVSSLIPNFATLRALLLTMLSLLAFAMLVRPAGLVIAISTMAFIATRAQPGHSLIGSVILSLSLSCICAVIFVYGIGLPIPLWP